MFFRFFRGCEERVIGVFAGGSWIFISTCLVCITAILFTLSLRSFFFRLNSAWSRQLIPILFNSWSRGFVSSVITAENDDSRGGTSPETCYTHTTCKVKHV